MKEKETANQKITDLIAKFALRINYWGYLFARIRRRPDPALPSIAAVGILKDGSLCLYYNPDLLMNTDEQSLEKILEHEGMHLVNGHIPRLLKIIADELNDTRIAAKSMIWNWAADCCVNIQIRMPKFINFGARKVEPLFPSTFKLPDDKASEFYYFRLLETEQYQTLCNDIALNKSIEQSFGKYFKNQVGSHTKWKDGLKEVSDINSLARKVSEYTKDIVSESYKNFKKQRGHLPGNLDQLIGNLLGPPFIPYYQMIRKLVRGSRMTKFQRSPTRINRKRAYVFFIDKDNNVPKISPFPGRMRDHSFKICILLDTSGSMSSKDILEGLSSIKNIIENDRHCITTVLENDTHVQKEYVVKKLGDIQFSVKGRGGTILGPGLKRARELNSDITLCFTDGYTDDINAIDRKFLPRKILWVITKDGSINNIDKSGYIIRMNK